MGKQDIGFIAVGLFVVLFVAGLMIQDWVKGRHPKTGTRSYYAIDRELLAYVHGEYLGGCFVPMMDIEAYLRKSDNFERVVLVETIPDEKG